MKEIKEIINTIICGDSLSVLKTFPDESIDCCLTSPPYWSLRDYKTEPIIWDGDKKCRHEWAEKITIATGQSYGANLTSTLTTGTTQARREEVQREIGMNIKVNSASCIKCNAWRGSLGLEPKFELYIAHLVRIFDEVKRVLKKTGTCWVNIGDTYHNATKWTNKNECPHTISGGNNRDFKTGRRDNQGLPEKSLCQIPSRFAIEMSNRGWILRNRIIWYKRNCMPASVRDRFTTDFEDIFFFVKNNDTQYWTNLKTLDIVGSQPAGIKGKEGHDWDWQDCPKCTNIFGTTKIDEDDAETMASPRTRYHRAIDKPKCLRCKGAGKIKRSNWTGHDYYFEPQYEPYQTESIERLQRAISDNNKWMFGADGQTPHNLSQPRDNVKKYKSDNAGIENCAINNTIFKGRDKLVAMPKSLINQMYYNGQAIKDYDSANVQNPSDTKRRILAGMREKIGLPENQSKYFECGITNQSELTIYRNEKRLEAKMPPIGGIKQTEGNDNPVYSGNQPGWTATGRNKRCVWDITTQGYSGAHFAVFPEELVETPILSGCPEFICKKCGLPKVKLTENVSIPTRPAIVKNTAKSGNDGDPNKQLHTRDPERHIIIDVKTKGYCSCKCNAGFESGIVLDPFGGAGTTGLVAKKLNRNYIIIDLNKEYCKMATKRINKEEKPLF